MSLLTCLAIYLAVPGVQLQGEPAPRPVQIRAEGSWERVLLPESLTERITDLGVDQDGVCWILAGGAAYYFDGELFQRGGGKAAGAKLAKRFVAGGERGLFVTARPVGNDGKLYRLAKAGIELEADYYHDAPNRPPCVYVAADGRLFHWGTRFLAVREKGKWKRVEARLSAREVFVRECAGHVFFYYNGQLYSVGRNGRTHHREVTAPILSEPSAKYVFVAPWGADRVIVGQSGQQDSFAFRLPTGESVDVSKINAQINQRHRIHDLFSAADGAVWILIHNWERRRFVFVRVPAEGPVETIEETEQLAWLSLRCWQDPACVLHATDGTLWFGTSTRGIGRYAASKLELYDWRAGVTGDFRHLCEGPDGEIWAAASGGVYRWHKADAASPPWVAQWEAVPLAAGGPLRDPEGDVWMLRADRPGQASRFDGARWTHFDAPFETRKVGRMLADDRGHLLVVMSRYPDGCWDVSQAGATHYRRIESMLVAAVDGGARRILVDRSFLGCVVLEDGRLWFGYQGQSSVNYYDGDRFDNLQVGQRLSALCESAEHGMLLRTDKGSYLTYDVGQLRELRVEMSKPGRYLFGEWAAQPYDAELVAMRPGELLLIERDGKLPCFPVVELPGDSKAPTRYLRGPALDPKLRWITRGMGGAHFSVFPRTPVWRIFGDSVLQLDLSESPIAGRERGVEEVVEDRSRNLWFRVRARKGSTAYLKRARGFEVELEGEAKTIGLSVTVQVRTSLFDRPWPATRLFWRTGGGGWRGVAAEGPVTLPMWREGRHDVEIVAMDRHGGITPAAIAFTVEAQAARPSTQLTAKGRMLTRDVNFRLPVTAVPSSPNRQAALAYRFAGGAWLPAKAGIATFFDRKPGEYVLEIAAYEGGLSGDRWLDDSPEKLTVIYKPDFSMMVEVRLAIVLGRKPGDAAAATAELQRLGIAILPLLHRGLPGAEPDLRAVLTALISVIESAAEAPR